MASEADPMRLNAENTDVLIINADVFDGSGAPAVKQDVALKNDRIVAVGDLQHGTARHVVNADGLALAPGFIDVHTHDDLELLRNPKMLNKISQGVTSVIIGNCGISASPYSGSACSTFQSSEIPPDPINLLGNTQEFLFSSLSDYIEQFNQIKPAINAAALVGHTSLRAQAMGDLQRSATQTEINQMIDLLKLAMEQGAKGLSSGLAYKNAQSASKQEMLALVKQLKPFNGVYSTHLRTEFDGIIDALDEAFFIAKQCDVALVISHLKCAGKNNWGRADEIVQHIQNHQVDQQISCDCYPYHASSSTLDLQQVTEDFEIFITWSESYPDKAKQALGAIAKQWQMSLFDAAKLLQPAGAVYHGMNENDVRKFISLPYSMIGSDGLPCDPHPHPRLWGTFPRVLSRYCRDEKLLSVASAIHKMTGLSAQQFELQNRGFIRQGYYADIVLFDVDTVADVANFDDPFAISKGINGVLVNGQLSYQADSSLFNSAIDKQGAGRFLKHGQN